MSDPTTLVSFSLFVGMAAMFCGLALLLVLERQSVSIRQRINRAAGRVSAVSDGHAQQGRRLGDRLRAVIVRIGDRMSAMLGGEARATQEELTTAGFTGRDALLIYAFLKTVVPVVTLAIGCALVLTTRPWGAGLILPLAMTVALALAMSMAIDFVVDAKRKARLDRIRIAFPDMLELLVITSEAGLGPQPALHRVADELQPAHPELAREILLMVSEMRMTNDRRSAYARLTARVPLPEIAVFTQTLDQSDTYGTPFSRAMRTLIADQRADRLLRVEEKAARLPVIMTVPLIFCIMPAVFVVLVGPAVLSVFDNIIAGG